GLVNGDTDAACGPDREVEQAPFVTRPGHEPDAVPRLQARRDQPFPDREYLVGELGCGDIEPGTTDLAAKTHRAPETFGVRPHHVGEVLVVGHARRGWGAELSHVENLR